MIIPGNDISNNGLERIYIDDGRANQKQGNWNFN